MIDADGSPTLPWLEGPLVRALAAHGHALLLHGAPGLGALDFALALAQSWLCDAPRPDGLACGRCASCSTLRGRVHPDLFVLLPETLRREADWPLGDDKPDEDAKRKPSRQIRIDEVRAGLDWVAKTAARGRGKAWVLHPAEALNEHSASALLKTAEEPPAGTRLVLTCTDPHAIRPTVRSRCQRIVLAAPPPAQALAWLAGQGVEQPEVLLAAASGRPLEALQLARDGVDARSWAALPRAVAAGTPGALAGWPVARALDALFKLGHDALALGAGAAPRYFAPSALPARTALPAPAALAGWVAELQRLARHAAHPWHEGLMADALLAQAHAAFAGKPSRPRPDALDTLPS